MRALFVLVLAVFSSVHSAKILAVFHFNGKSHFMMLEALAKGLAAKGHEVTVVGHFPLETPLPNYKDISLKGTVDNWVNNVTLSFITENWRDDLGMLKFIWKRIGVELCETMLKTPVVQDLIKTDVKYDVLITELWSSDCIAPLANVLDVPHIAMITTMEVPWSLERFGSPLNPAYQVNHFTTFSPRGMTFLQRVYNTIFTAYMQLGYYYNSEIPTESLVQKYFGPSLPPLSDIIRNTSLLFVNSHFSMLGSRPQTPNVIDVGGLHIPEPKPLPEDLKKFMDNAKSGVILFSLGSLIRADSLGEKILEAFTEVFRNLDVAVIWKYNGPLKNQPKNVKTVKWLPQSDLLRHPNVKFFITHGGLMGTQEAIAAGVPMLGIPFFADQRFNLLHYQEKGFAIKLELEELTPDNIRKAILLLLHDSRYMRNAKLYSELFRDRPQTALETAIYWTEYVIRHKGARFLRPAAVDLPFYKLYLLDVIGFCLLCWGIAIYLPVIALRKFCRFRKIKTD